METERRIMKNVLTILLFAILVTLSGCEAIGDIFSAGMYTGMFVVVLVIVVIIFIIARLGRRR
jgi:hypothetical protein